MSKKLFEDFINMVKIDSESGEEENFITYLADLFTNEFKAHCSRDDYGNLIIMVEAKSSTGGKPLFLSCHADTVKPGKEIEPEIKNGVISAGGETILGADDKAGIAELIEAIRTVEKHPPLEIVITREEELGLIGAQHIDISMLKSERGFLIDNEPLDAIVIGGPSYMRIDIEITGRAAHTGLDPEKGISAIKAASYAISMLKEGRVDEESTVNVGTIEGGENRNGVPEKVHIKAECRSLIHEKCVSHANLIKEIFITSAKSIGASAKVNLNLAYKAISISEDAEVVQIAKRAIESVGLTPRLQVLTCGTDASIYNAKGIQTVAIAFGGKGAHSREENIAIADMEKAVKILTYILEETSY
jgi:tripeptide aminopeptidase